MSGKQASIPRVSVICIFFNAERYFREAIDSVLDQDFQDFELLLVDDGSDDGTTETAHQFAASHPGRVRYLHHPAHANRGMSATRNLGLAKARGEFVAFIDADDRWHRTKLREQVEMLDCLPNVDGLAGSANYWSSHSGGKDRIVPTGHVRDHVIPARQATLQFYPLGKANAPSMSDLLFRRSAIEAVGGFEERFRGAYEDQAFLAKFYLNSALFVTDKVWSDYRLHDQSCMARLQQSGGYADTRRAFLEWFEGFVATSPHANDRQIGSALDRAFRPYRPRATIGRIRETLRKTPLGPIVRTGKAALRRLRPIVTPGPAILMYHRVAEETFDPWGLAVSPTNFGDQLEWIKRRRTPFSLPQFVELNAQGKLPRDAIAVTFDDGYACSAAQALPLLEQLGIPATIFIPAELIARGGEFWWDELQRVVMGTSATMLDLDGHEIALGERNADDAVWPSGEPRTPRQWAYHQLWKLTHAKRPEAIDETLDRLRMQSQMSNSPRETHRPMTGEEIRQTQSALIEFGSHALTHPSLPRLDPEERARQISGSIAACAEMTGVRPRSFAYPYGDFDADSRRLVEEAGYACACRAEGWFVRPGTDRFALPRIFVGNWDSTKLARQLGRP